MDLRYPIGKYSPSEEFTPDLINSWMDIIREFPVKLSDEVAALTKGQLNWKYRSGGWSIAQVIHHCADSHMNSFLRFKWTLTEESPIIKAYFEDRWADLPDSLTDSVQCSLDLISGLHSRWYILLKNLSDEKLDRTFTHPETGKKITLKQNIGLYAWHCEHHLAHIRQALEYRGNFE